MPLIDTTPAMRSCTPQSNVPTPLGPVFDATLNATRAPVEWQTRMMFFAVAGNRRLISWTRRKRHSYAVVHGSPWTCVVQPGSPTSQSSMSVGSVESLGWMPDGVAVYRLADALVNVIATPG